MLKEIEAERDAIALTEKVSAHTNAKKIQNLVKLKAIGAEIATVLTGEVFYRPFNNRHQVASYVGLTPSPFQSGSKCRDQGISKAGNPKARSTMIELASLWLRHQPDSPLSIWFQRACRDPQGSHPAHHHRRGGPQVADRPVALFGERRGADGRRSELIRARVEILKTDKGNMPIQGG